jgi:hypothetical protein
VGKWGNRTLPRSTASAMSDPKRLFRALLFHSIQAIIGSRLGCFHEMNLTPTPIPPSKIGHPIPFDRIKRRAIAGISIIVIIFLLPLAGVYFHILPRGVLYIFAFAFVGAIGSIIWELIFSANFTNVMFEYIRIIFKLLINMIAGCFAGGALVAIVSGIGITLPAPYVAIAGFFIYGVVAFYFIRKAITGQVHFHRSKQPK